MSTVPDWSIHSIPSQSRFQRGFISFVLLGFLEGGNWKTSSKIYMPMQRVEQFWKRTKAEGLKWLDFKTTYKHTVIETMWYWHKDEQMKKWNRIKNPEYFHTCMDKEFLIRVQRQFNGEEFFHQSSWKKKKVHLYSEKWAFIQTS